MINIEECFPLKQFNTFGLDVTCRFFAEADSYSDIQTVLNVFRDNPLPKIILGGGSNILFKSNFEGIVIYPCLKGISVLKEEDGHIWVKAYAGEVWDDFVKYCTANNWGGIENLSLIPGNIGACPIQNIGAYGVEVKDSIDSVDTINIETGEITVFKNHECNFGYRDSIFKTIAKDKYLIVSVNFKLSKKPLPNIDYKDVREELKQYNDISIKTIREAIISIRRRKLPDPAEFGNAGSFFKNPVVHLKHFENIKNKYPEAPSYPINNEEVKLPSAWLIEKAGWKGVREGNTGTHPTQPLVIINYGKATGTEILHFANKIQQSVIEKFNIALEMEVRVV
jgi:UDP-N-acetylmuramate dehydrogenase